MGRTEAGEQNRYNNLKVILQITNCCNKIHTTKLYHRCKAIIIKTQTDNEINMTIIKIGGVLVDMLLDINLDIYGPYITTDKKKI